MNRKYSCAVVQVTPGQFEVTTPYDVDLGARRRTYEGLKMRVIYSLDGIQGKYAFHDHFVVAGDAETVEQFQENIDAIVQKLTGEATAEKSLTLGGIREILTSNGYHIDYQA